MSAKKKRQVSPPYPFFSLKECVNLVNKLIKTAGQTEVTKENALTHMGLEPKKPDTHRAYSALTNFGLISERRSGKSKKVSVTNLARNILVTKGDNNPIKINALQSAASNYEIIRELRMRWTDDLPEDDMIYNALVTDLGFYERAAKSFLPSFKETYKFAKLGGSDILPSIQDSGDYIPEDINGNGTKKDMTFNQVPEGHKISKITLAGGKEIILLSPAELSTSEFKFMKLWLEQLNLVKDESFEPPFEEDDDRGHFDEIK